MNGIDMTNTKTVKWLHIELNEGGLYVYADNNTLRHKEVSLNELDCECCIADGIPVMNGLAVLKGNVAIRININKLVNCDEVKRTDPDGL